MKIIPLKNNRKSQIGSRHTKKTLKKYFLASWTALKFVFNYNVPNSINFNSMYKVLPLALAFFAFDIKANCQISTETDSVPVRVSYFTAANNINKNMLNWKVVCYLNYANFQVERSTNGSDYTTINTFTADRIRCQSPFNLEDRLSSWRTFYRLKVGDRDGNFSTSKVVVVFGKEKSFEINSITPNLVINNTLLRVFSSERGTVEISVTNQQGNVVKRQSMLLNKGNTELELDLSILSKGLYFLKLRNSASEVRIAKLIKL